MKKKKKYYGMKYQFYKNLYISKNHFYPYQNHPNIIKIYEFHETPDKFFIIQEFCEGGELMDRLTIEGRL